MKNIVVFASGSGTNAENLVRYFENHPTMRVVFILSNKPQAYVHQRAKALGIPSYTYTKEEFTNGTVLKLLQENNIDFVVLAGYMVMIDNDMLEAFPQRIVNIHPSLLPKYGGKGFYGEHVHEAVVAAKEEVSGITIHYVNECYDSGAIIFQAQVALEEGETADSLAAKIHKLEYQHYPVVIEELIRN